MVLSLNPMDWITEGIDYILYNFIYRIFYLIEIALCMGLSWLQQLMDVFTGSSYVTYDTKFGSEQNYLINIFFSNGAVSGAYWGMAAIGVVLAFLFAVISMVRKMFDMDDKVKMSIGQILTNLLKSIFLIILLNAGMTVIITGTNVLMQSVNYVFDHSTEIANGEDHIDFTDEEYAAMARIFNTVGNYSLNPSYKNRYNINACYNDIRGDLKYLADQGVFDYYYETRDADNNVVPTWQSVLQNIANAADYNREAPVDVYNEGIANALYECMTLLKTDASLTALESYDRIEEYDSDSVEMGRILFIVGTMGNGVTAAAKNDAYNVHPSLTDPVRAPYYRGVKDIYDISQVNQDFDIALTKTNYIIVYIVGAALVFNMALILVSCVARIFNLMFLYLIAPPIFAVMPLDDGGKVKQWTTAFVVQAFSIFATVISMRIYLIFVPIVMDPGLHISDSVIIDMVGRLILIFAGVEAVTKANGILTGILADNAGWQSINAGDMSGYLKNSFVGQMGGRLSSAINHMPAKALGGQKFSDWLDGKDVSNQKAGGLAGIASKGVDLATKGLGAGANKLMSYNTPGPGTSTQNSKTPEQKTTAMPGKQDGGKSDIPPKATGASESVGEKMQTQDAATPPPQRNN